MKYSLDELKEISRANASRFKGINGWIENNPNTDPNVYEMVDCTIALAKTCSLYKRYFDEHGYPTLDDGHKANRYEIKDVVPELKEEEEELDKMYDLRSNSDLLKDKRLKGLMRSLRYQGLSGSYNIHEHEGVEKLKEEVIKKSASVYFYILQVQKNEPNYKYDNVNEFDELKNNYSMYKEFVGVEETVNFEDGEVYSGPQFGYSIENLIDGINENYIYKDKDNVSGIHR